MWTLNRHGLPAIYQGVLRLSAQNWETLLEGSHKGTSSISHILYINDLPQASELFALLFADDTTLSASDKNLEHLVQKIHIEFQKSKEYFRANKMLLHEKKTQFLLFHPSFSTFSSANVDIFVNNNNINAKHNTIACSRLTNGDYDSHVPFIKFLGVLAEPSL